MSVLIKAFEHLGKHGHIGIRYLTQTFGMTHQEFMANFKHIGFYYMENGTRIGYRQQIKPPKPAKITAITGAKMRALIPHPVTNGIGGSWVSR